MADTKRSTLTNVVSLAEARPSTSGPGRPRHPADRLLHALGDAARSAALSNDRDLSDAVRYVADVIQERLFSVGHEERERAARERVFEIATLARTRTRRSARGRKTNIPDLRPDMPVTEEHFFADLEFLARGDVEDDMIAGLVGYIREHGARVLGLDVRPDLHRRVGTVLRAKKAPSQAAKRVRAILGPRGLGLRRERVTSRTRTR
jgi:hypothetical protein